MRILLASGIYEPEIGGPAIYAARLKRELIALGHEVRVVTYGNRGVPQESGVIRVLRSNKLLNRVRYFFAVWPEVKKAEVVYLLDWFAAGVPAAIAARLARKPYLVRVGGDYLWEQRYLESGQEPVSLATFYARNLYRKYPVLFFLVRRVLRGARHVVFNSDIQRALYDDYYELHRTSTIYNPVPSVSTGSELRDRKKEFVYWGRLIEMKNVASLVRAFILAQLPGYTLRIIGDGPRWKQLEWLIQRNSKQGSITLEPSMPNAAVLESVRSARAFVLPSWTDIAPNQVHEALAIGLPALVTEESYLAIREQLPLTIDPYSVDDIAQKMRMLADDEQYERFRTAFCAIRFDHSWKDVAREHEALFKTLV